MASKAKNQELEEKVPDREVLIRPPAHTPLPSDSTNREKKKHENSLFNMNTFGFPLLPLARIDLWSKCHEVLETVHFFFSDVPGCGGDRHGALFGEIQSPKHPEMYPNDLHCEWNITVPKGFRINITFTIFDLESFYICEYDWISLRSGNATLGKFCGSMFPKPNWKHKALPSKYSISPTNECILTFHSDYSNEEHYSGFIAHYAAIGKLHFTVIYLF